MEPPCTWKKISPRTSHKNHKHLIFNLVTQIIITNAHHAFNLLTQIPIIDTGSTIFSKNLSIFAIMKHTSSNNPFPWELEGNEVMLPLIPSNPHGE